MCWLVKLIICHRFTLLSKRQLKVNKTKYSLFVKKRLCSNMNLDMHKLVIPLINVYIVFSINKFTQYIYIYILIYLCVGDKT